MLFLLALFISSQLMGLQNGVFALMSICGVTLRLPSGGRELSRRSEVNEIDSGGMRSYPSHVGMKRSSGEV